MTGEKFAEIVTKRANERVQVRLKTFKEQVYTAFRNLMGETGLRPSGEGNKKDKEDYNRAILQQMLEQKTIGITEAWPKVIWKEEEECVTKELLSMMDEMQKALIAPGPKEDDCTSD